MPRTTTTALREAVHRRPLRYYCCSNISRLQNAIPLQIDTCVPRCTRCLMQLRHHHHTCRSWRCLTSSSDRFISGIFSFMDCFTLSMLLSISLYLLNTRQANRASTQQRGNARKHSPVERSHAVTTFCWRLVQMYARVKDAHFQVSRTHSDDQDHLAHAAWNQRTDVANAACKGT